MANYKFTDGTYTSSEKRIDCMAMMAVFTTILKNKKEYPEAFDTITAASLVEDMADSCK
jgi:hypothetical protein